jgi:dTDP-4-dehydrorhamnose 3,5-epimerase-like enzyme
MTLPSEIAEYFAKIKHPRFPILEIPQVIDDHRGSILNIVDGQIGDVALIRSNINSLRANHYHEQDWHLSYILSGVAEYKFKLVDTNGSAQWDSLTLSKGDLLFTPKKVWHRFKFLSQTDMIVVSKMSRVTHIYESDTVRDNQHPD